MRLIEPAINKIGKTLKNALGVRSVLLSGNTGIHHDLI